MAGKRGEVSTRQVNRFESRFVTPESNLSRKAYRGYTDHGQGESKIDGELKNSRIKVTTGELNDENQFKQIKYPDIDYDVFLFREVPATVCVLQDSSELVVLGGFTGDTDHFINIFPDIFPDITGTTLFYQNLQFSNGSPTNQDNAIQYGNNPNFPNQILVAANQQPPEFPQYSVHTIQAYDSSRDSAGLTLSPSCATEKTFTVVRCKIGTAVTNTNIGINETINPTDFFTGLDVNTDFTITANNETVDSDIYTITTPTVTLKCFDNVDNSCTQTVVLNIETCPLTGLDPFVFGQIGNQFIDVTLSFNGLPNAPDLPQTDTRYFVQLLQTNNSTGIAEPVDGNTVLDALRPPYKVEGNYEVGTGLIGLYEDAVTGQGNEHNVKSFREFPANKSNIINELLDFLPNSSLDTFDEPFPITHIKFIARDIVDPTCQKETSLYELTEERFSALAIARITGLKGNACGLCNPDQIGTTSGGFDEEGNPINFDHSSFIADDISVYIVYMREFSTDETVPDSYSSVSDCFSETFEFCHSNNIKILRNFSNAVFVFNQSSFNQQINYPSGASNYAPGGLYKDGTLNVDDNSRIYNWINNTFGPSAPSARQWSTQAINCEQYNVEQTSNPVCIGG